MSEKAQTFDPLNIPIEGTNLIEASAGTGKTYGIAALFTRLVVLERLPVESVLAVTFTKAATAELKTRLRARLDEVLQVLENISDAEDGSDGLDAYCAAHHPDDAFLPALLRRALRQESRGRLIVRLKAAIGQFDNAAIYTIHGFCQRILRDYAFLCSAPLDVELTEDNRDRLLVPAQDFWRERISGNPVLSKLVFNRRYTPQTMLAQIQKFTGRPYLVFRRPENTLEAAQQSAQAAWENIRSKLPELEAAFWRIHPALNGSSYRGNTFTGVFAELNAAAGYESLPKLSKTTYEKLPMFSAEALENGLKKGQSPDTAAFDALQELANFGRDLNSAAEAEQNTLTLLCLELLDYLADALSEQKKARRERGFDDLLLDVHHALTDNPHAETLAQTVARNWRVALIDEFQDTDPLQYEIFQKIFIAQGNPLFLVGDPKQAIYSFRGADIYAYLQAAEDARHHYTLATNYRSHAKLVDSIGALFRRKNHPFVLERIDYADVGAARKTSRLTPARPAVQVRWLHGADAEPPNKDILRKRAAEYCADEIAAALNDAEEGRLNFKDRPLQSGDIAVLVRTHNEGSMIARALKNRGIQSVLLHRTSVFASAEARTTASLLEFWLDPRRTEPLRFALAGVLFRYTAAELHALNRDEARLLDWMDSAQTAHEQWKQQGIYAAMQHFSARHGIEARLLSQDGERSLTNYHQILELLAEEDAHNRNPSSLYQWLLEQISLASGDKKTSGENDLIRLESDEALVKIVTMHASKGLQYPLVYCPFVWDAQSLKSGDWQILHRSGGTAELLAGHQLDDADQARLADEETSERLRLLYVALTRAEEQLNIYAACCDGTPDNTFAYLLEGRADSSRVETQKAYLHRKSGKGGKTALMQMLEDNWRQFIAHAPDNTDFAFADKAPAETASQSRRGGGITYRAAVIPERSFDIVRHTSFTGLSRHVKTRDDEREELQPALDPAENIERPSENIVSDGLTDAEDIHHFPRGTNAGICLHEILEKFDFSLSAAEQAETVRESLSRYGFEPRWQSAVHTMLDRCRLAPLTAAYALADIPPQNRLPEMGFTLYMEDFGLERLRAWFARPNSGLPPECAEAARILDFRDVQGFLSGFIDMVYQDSDGLVCIIDYKSNHLGNNAEAYTPQAMNEAMAHHHYYLQALIYAIAVARYYALRRRPLPRIAVRYLFLRGLDGGENGVWSWNIDTADLTEWL